MDSLSRRTSIGVVLFSGLDWIHCRRLVRGAASTDDTDHSFLRYQDVDESKRTMKRSSNESTRRSWQMQPIIARLPRTRLLFATSHTIVHTHQCLNIQFNSACMQWRTVQLLEHIRRERAQVRKLLVHVLK